MRVIKRRRLLQPQALALLTALAIAGCTRPGDDPRTGHGAAAEVHQLPRDRAQVRPQPAAHRAPSDMPRLPSERQWVPAQLAFGHPWPLGGAHARALCAACHSGEPPVYQGTPTECVGCHQDRLRQQPLPRARRLPNHVRELSLHRAVGPRTLDARASIQPSDRERAERTQIVWAAMTAITRAPRWIRSTAKSRTTRAALRPPISAYDCHADGRD